MRVRHPLLQFCPRRSIPTCGSSTLLMCRVCGVLVPDALPFAYAALTGPHVDAGVEASSGAGVAGGH
jgi:hypothetical protein